MVIDEAVNLQNRWWDGSKLQAWLYDKKPTGMQQVDGPRDADTNKVISPPSIAYFEADIFPNEYQPTHQTGLKTKNVLNAPSGRHKCKAQWKYDSIPAVNPIDTPPNSFNPGIYIAENTSLSIRLWVPPPHASRRSSASTTSSGYSSLPSDAYGINQIGGFPQDAPASFYDSLDCVTRQRTETSFHSALSRRRLTVCHTQDTPLNNGTTVYRSKTGERSIEVRNLPCKTGRKDLQSLLIGDMQLTKAGFKIIAGERGHSKRSWRVEFHDASQAKEVVQKLQGAKVGRGWLESVHGNVFRIRLSDNQQGICIPSTAPWKGPVIIDGSVSG